ncbi:hypothetical protein [Labrys neptuniae]
MTAISHSGLCADSIVMHSILAATPPDAAALPEEWARTLFLAWLLSLEDGIDLAGQAAALKDLLLGASSPDNPLLPYLTRLLDDVSEYAGRRRGRRRHADA